jgi:hypothetical protein
LGPSDRSGILAAVESADAYEEVAGDLPRRLDEHLAAMESEELLRLADELREMMRSPGWQRLVELVAMQRADIERHAVRRLWKHFAAGQPLRDQTQFLRLGGLSQGLGRPETIATSVLKTAVVVRKRLGIEGGS